MVTSITYIYPGLKKSSYDFRDAEYILAMRDGKEHVVMQMAAELYHLLAMTRRAEPTTTAGEREQIFMVTIRAAHTCKTLLKIPTFQVLPNYMGNEGNAVLHGRAGRLNLSKPAEIDAQSLAELLDGHPRQAAYPGRL